VQRWAEQQPEAAATWVTDFPQGPLQDAALEELVKLWTDQNPQQAGTWLRALEPGSAHDVAVDAYVVQLAPQSPAVAAQRTQDIGNENLRVRDMETVAVAWLDSDASAARSWITQSALPPPVKARLLAPGQ